MMAVAKAALECSVRYLAYELGDGGIRVNAISAGPVRTLAAKGIPGFSDMEAVIEERSPLRRNIDASDVGNAALYLCGPLGAMVTGTTLYVDSRLPRDGHVMTVSSRCWAAARPGRTLARRPAATCWSTASGGC